jgi:hypothetical protein
MTSGGWVAFAPAMTAVGVELVTIVGTAGVHDAIRRIKRINLAL